jgi:membrane protein YdbS with pleckstrin-like domain
VENSGNRKEIVMNAQSNKSMAGKVASFAIIALVLVGAMAISGIAEVPGSSSLLSKFFIFFIGAIIVVQIVPCVMLLSAMVKGVVGALSRKPGTVEIRK